MTEEQKEAMKRLKMHKDFAGMDNGCCVVNAKDLEIVFTLIEQQKEQIDYLRRSCGRKENILIEEQQENAELENKLKEKDKIINLMVNHIATSDSYLCQYLDITTKCKYYAGENGNTCDECIKQYFENKAKEV